MFRAAPEAKYWRRLWSVQIMVFGAFFSGVSAIMGAFGGLVWVQDHPFQFAAIAGGINVLAIGARLLDQTYLVKDWHDDSVDR